jgi:2,3-bisphosphoglycerate-independent phosphoglycerate mutase
MDRDKRWDRTEKAYRAIVAGQGEQSQANPAAVIEAWYAQSDPQPGFGDEFLHPTVLLDPSGQAIATVQENDVVIHFNFRPDRARQLTQALTEEDFTGFDRGPRPQLANYTCMASYGEQFSLPVAYEKEPLKMILGEVIADAGIKQFRCAETEKYAHVTYFFNGGEERVFPGEERRLIPSDRSVATYDLAPAMKAREVTEAVLEALATKQFGFFVINFANPDMVGHTGNEAAAIQAVEVLDDCLNRIISAVEAQDGQIIITADHGNCEEMVDAEGYPHTQHTLNPVPFLVIGKHLSALRLKPGRLCDVAPTVLELIGLPQPEKMTGTSLIVHP